MVLRGSKSSSSWIISHSKKIVRKNTFLYQCSNNFVSLQSKSSIYLKNTYSLHRRSNFSGGTGLEEWLLGESSSRYKSWSHSNQLNDVDAGNY